MSSSSAIELLHMGVAAASAGRKEEARNLLCRSIKQDRDQEATWQWLASVARDQEEIKTCMEESLRLNPGNTAARDWLESYRLLLEASARVPTATQSVEEQVEEQVEERKVPLILIADDSPLIRLSLIDALEPQGFDLAQAKDGDEALEQMLERMPDLAILDIKMPGQTGLEVCEAAKATPSIRHIPIIFLSGHGGFAAKVSARRVGAAGYLTKPFDPAVLLLLIERNLTSTSVVNA